MQSQYSTPIDKMHYRRDIDGLRAIAVLSVVCFHAFGMRGGFIGVDIFFVISGYLISTILLTNIENKDFNFSRFYLKRIKRILPALILVFFTCFAIGWFILLPEEYKQLGKHIAGASVFISNYILWHESGYFDNAAATKPLLHLWSLGIEEQFYIIWPLLLWLMWKKRFSLIYTIVIIAFISFILNIKGVRSDSVATFYSPQTRFWELLCGSLLAWIVLFEQKKKNDLQDTHRQIINNLFSIFGILLITYGLLSLTKENFFPGALALIPTVGAMFVIFAGSTAWINRTILSHRLLVWFGLISFPLYLWHWPLLVFSKLSFAGGMLSSRSTKIFAVTLSILLAWLTYKFIETPIRRGQASKTKAIILLTLLGMAGSVGYLIYANNGVTFRVPTILKDTSRSFKYLAKYNLGTCFLEGNVKQFGDCMMNTDSSKKTILIWGDSHAAHLYAGYENRFGKNYNIILRSAAGCRPILGGKDNARNKGCNNVNNNILALIQNIKPDKVILSAAWGHHNDWRGVTNTIKKLNGLGIKNIDLIGPAPDWVDTLPRQLFIYSQKNPQHEVPVRMSFGLVPDFLKLDKLMKTLALREKINYISLADILCNPNGCMTRVGNNFDDLITLDYGHFTEFGSIYLVSKFPLGDRSRKAQLLSP